MSILNKFQVARKAVQQLGLKPVLFTALYQVGVKSGFYRFITPPRKGDLFNRIPTETADVIRTFSQHGWSIPSSQVLLDNFPGALDAVLAEAENLTAGFINLFGAKPMPLQLEPPSNKIHWTRVAVDENTGEDIKFTWESARFGWAFTLGRAYVYSGDEKYAETFWKYTEIFLNQNPLNIGANWISGQEIALRIIAFCFAVQVFQYSPHSTLARQARLVNSIREHTNRIPPTLIYARGQNNNHLLSEAVGLYTAGIFLGGEAQAQRWRKTGFSLFCSAILEQILPDGTYIQHSTNYHRVMMQLALMFKTLSEKNGDDFPDEVKLRLSSAANWLTSHMDLRSGFASNLGHNDGSNLFLLSSSPYEDFRPIAQAASRSFLGEACLPSGEWDELSLWFGMPLSPTGKSSKYLKVNSTELFLVNSETWGSLRAATFINRPAHADQLHVDLWWKGINIAMDAGTYRYSAAAPWNNSLMGTAVHDTVTINSEDQMRRAGRFLWLDWAQARRCVECEKQNTLVAEHDGYKKLGILHRRFLSFHEPKQWTVTDLLLEEPNFHPPYQISLNWLLPDGKWEIDGTSLTMGYDFGNIILSLCAEEVTSDSNSNSRFPPAPGSEAMTPIDAKLRLIRCGKAVYGPTLPGDDVLGWYSPTYSMIKPALSFQLKSMISSRSQITSTWELN